MAEKENPSPACEGSQDSFAREKYSTFQQVAGTLALFDYWPVPIKPNDKRPAVPGWQKLRLGIAELVNWSGDPNCGVGILCGVGGYPIAAADVDAPNSELSERFAKWCLQNLGPAPCRIGQAPKRLLAYQAAEPGWRKRTSAGYKDSEGRTNRLELLAEGQQFVAAGIHPGTGRPYAWINGRDLNAVPADRLPVITAEQVAQAIEAFERFAEAMGMERATDGNKDRPEPRKALHPVPLDSDASLAVALAYLRTEAEPAVSGACGNTTTFNTAARLRDLGVTQHRAGLLMLNCYNDDCIPPWPHGDLLRIVASAYKSTENGLGCDSPEADFTSVTVQPAGGALKNRLLAAGFTGRDAYRRAMERAKRRWLVEKILLAGSPLAVMLGLPKAGKSLISLDLALCVTMGIPWWGRKVMQAPVLFLTGEGMAGMSVRISAWLARHGIDPDHADLSRFHVLPLPQLDTRDGLRAALDAIAILQEQMGENFGLIVVDTVARAMTGDENSAKDMGALVAATDTLHRRTGGCVLAIHHHGKDPARGGRGSNALLGALDLELIATRQDDVTALAASNARDQDLFEPLHFKLEWVDAGIITADLDSLGSPVPVLCDPPGAAKELDAADAAALDILEELAEASPACYGWVDAAEWRKAMAPEASAEAQRTRFYRAERTLKGLGLIEVQGERKQKRIRPTGSSTPENALNTQKISDD